MATIMPSSPNILHAQLILCHHTAIRYDSHALLIDTRPFVIINALTLYHTHVDVNGLGRVVLQDEILAIELRHHLHMSGPAAEY